MTAPEVAYSLDHLGALAAEHVLGWSDELIPYFGNSGWEVWEASSAAAGAGRLVRLAEDIGDAWRLVDKLAEDGFHCVIKTPFKLRDAHHAGFTPHGVTGWNGRPDYPSGPAPNPAAAIALAALSAVGHPVRLELGEEG